MAMYQLIKVGLILFFFQMMCLTLTLVQIEYFDDIYSPLWAMFILFAIIIVYCCQPVIKCGYRTARYQLLYTIW